LESAGTSISFSLKWMVSQLNRSSSALRKPAKIPIHALPPGMMDPLAVT
jgi:hypothetical protein